MKRPMLWVASLYAAGVLLAEYISLPLMPLWAASLAVGLFALCLRRLRHYTLLPLVVIVGALGLTLSKAILSATDLRRILPRSAELITIRGVIPDTPAIREYNNGEKRTWRSVAQIEAREVRLHRGEWQPASGRIAVSTAGELTNFFGGQTVEIEGVADLPKRAAAEGLFDYRAYLARQRIYFHLEVSSLKDWQLLASPAHPPFADRFRAWARGALARGLPGQDQALQLEWALTLGDKKVLTEDVSEPFIQAATYHIFAVDGLRMAIVFGIVFELLRFLRIPRPLAGAILIPMIWAYVGLTGWPASAIRATVMLTLVIGGWVLRRPLDLFNSLFTAAFLILLWDPQQLFQAGFQLSFFIVLCIILLMPWFEKAHARIFRQEPLLPPELHRKWPSLLRIPVRFLWGTFLVSLAAWLGSLPLSAYYFNIFSHMSTPANFFAVPLCGLVLISNLSSLLCAALLPWLPWLGEIFNHAGWCFMRGIEITTGWFVVSPQLYRYVATPSFLTCALYYALFIGLATGWLLRPRLRVYRITAVVVVLLAWLGMEVQESGVHRLTILPLSGSSCLFCEGCPSGREMLVNCGSEFAAGFTIKPFLRARGVNALSNLVLTHGDVRLCGGVPMVDDLFHVERAWAGAAHARSSAYRHALELLDTRDRLHLINAGSSIAEWQVLHPSADKVFPRAEDNALVLRAEIGGAKVLYLSELGKAGQMALLEHASELRSEIVIAGLPNQTEPLAPALLSAIRPKLIILADSDQPTSHRAGGKLLSRLRASGMPVLVLHDEGAITVEGDRSDWELRTMFGTRIKSRDLVSSYTPAGAAPPESAAIIDAGGGKTSY